MRISKFDKFFLLNEDIDISNLFQTIPEGSAIPSSGVVKLGIDPTSDKIHLGHLIPIRMVKKLKEKGMSVVIILGTFTARLGDPSGKDSMRPILSAENTKANADSIISQLHRVLGTDITIRYNSEWFDKMSLPEIMQVLSKYTVEYLMSRDSFKKRSQDGNNIGMHELIVPILQGLDSVEIKAAVEVGGTDQLFNFLISRDLQSKFGQNPEICLMSPVINGTDGRKMSKSYNNCIYINDAPKDVFGKSMSISDEVMKQWLPLFIESYDPSTHPMQLKKQLAATITDIIWGEGAGTKEKEAFESTVQSRKLPDDIPEFPATNILDFAKEVGGVSKSDARRLLQQGGITINDEKIGDIAHVVKPGDIVKVGKRKYGKAI